MKNYPLAIGLVIGALYGLLLRGAFEWDAFSGMYEIVSNSFLLLAPFATGAIAVFFGSRARRLDVADQIGIAVGMTRTLSLFFGRDWMTFEVTSLAPNVVQKTRTYKRFSDAARDVVDGRVYLGHSLPLRRGSGSHTGHACSRVDVQSLPAADRRPQALRGVNGSGLHGFAVKPLP
jgi:hypothetical protein